VESTHHQERQSDRRGRWPIRWHAAGRRHWHLGSPNINIIWGTGLLERGPRWFVRNSWLEFSEGTISRTLSACSIWHQPLCLTRHLAVCPTAASSSFSNAKVPFAKALWLAVLRQPVLSGVRWQAARVKVVVASFMQPEAIYPLLAS
jgi:hypothetical protein